MTEPSVPSEQSASRLPASPVIPDPPHIGEEVDAFVKHIDSIAETLPLSMAVIQWTNREATEKYEQFKKEHCQVEHDGGKESLRFSIDLYWRHKKLRKRLDNAALAWRLVPRSLLVSLVSQYDAFLGALIRKLTSSTQQP